MRCRLPRLTRCSVAAAALALAAAAAAGAGQSADLDLSLRSLGLPSAETGKPPSAFPAVPPAPNGGRCLPALPCGSRLYGAARKNGAIELQVPALHW